jgi:hypothetical protein
MLAMNVSPLLAGSRVKRGAGTGIEAGLTQEVKNLHREPGRQLKSS